MEPGCKAERILMERPSGSAVFQTTWFAPFMSNTNKQQIVQHTNKLFGQQKHSIGPVDSDRSDESRGWDEMEEGSSGSLFLPLTGD
jgi:hypothetical protein